MRTAPAVRVAAGSGVAALPPRRRGGGGEGDDAAILPAARRGGGDARRARRGSPWPDWPGPARGSAARCRPGGSARAGGGRAVRFPASGIPGEAGGVAEPPEWAPREAAAAERSPRSCR